MQTLRNEPMLAPRMKAAMAKKMENWSGVKGGGASELSGFQQCLRQCSCAAAAVGYRRSSGPGDARRSSSVDGAVRLCVLFDGADVRSGHRRAGLADPNVHGVLTGTDVQMPGSGDVPAG